MMRCLVRFLWASVLGVGVMAGLARGAEQAPMPTAATPAPMFMTLPPPPGWPGGMGGPKAPRADLSQLKEVFSQEVNENQVRKMPPRGCYSHHNCFSCGSLESECRFIFGSCRAFFGNPCSKGPCFPPDPVAAYRPPGSCFCP